MALRRTLIALGCLAALVGLVFGFSPSRSMAGDSTGTGGTHNAAAASVARFTGAIVSIDQTSVAVRLSGGVRTLPLAQQVVVLLMDGTLGTVSQVEPGQYALIYVHDGYSAAATVTAIVVLGQAGHSTAAATSTPAATATASAVTTAVNGTITAIDQTSLTLSTGDGTRTYALGQQVSVRIHGQTSTISQITVPAYARVYMRTATGSSYPVVIGVMVGEGTAATVSPTATQARTSYSAITGTVTAIDSTSLTITTADGSHTYALGPQVSVRVNGQSGTLSQLMLPQQARVYIRLVAGSEPAVVAVIVGETTAAPTATPAVSPTAAPEKATYSVLTGTVGAIDSTSLTLTNGDGSHTYALAPQASVRLANGTRGTVTSVTTGMHVEIYLRSAAGATPLVVGIVVQQTGR